MSIGLQLANRNDYVSVQDHINNNLTNLEEMIDNNSGKKITGYIQDSGEKVLGNYYLDKLTTGLFKCIKSGNINYNSSEYFENDSNYALSYKLQNLLECISYVVDINLEIGKVYDTGIKYPLGKTLWSYYAIVGSAFIDLTPAGFSTDKFICNVGCSGETGNIQFSILEQNYPKNGHTIYMLFI